MFTALFILSLSTYACTESTEPEAASQSDAVRSSRGNSGDRGKPVEEERSGPGADATDTRVPELGADLNVLKTSKLTMAQGLAQSEKAHGPSIEAKFELADGKLSLSV
jgi:hypothetical protein